MKLPVPSDFFYVTANRENESVKELLKSTTEFSVKTFPSFDVIKVNKAFLICVDSTTEKFLDFFKNSTPTYSGKCQDLNSSIVFSKDVIQNPLLEIIKIAFLQGAIQYNRYNIISNIVRGANIERNGLSLRAVGEAVRATITLRKQKKLPLDQRQMMKRDKL